MCSGAADSAAPEPSPRFRVRRRSAVPPTWRYRWLRCRLRTRRSAVMPTWHHQRLREQPGSLRPAVMPNRHHRSLRDARRLRRASDAPRAPFRAAPARSEPAPPRSALPSCAPPYGRPVYWRVYPHVNFSTDRTAAPDRRVSARVLARELPDPRANFVCSSTFGIAGEWVQPTSWSRTRRRRSAALSVRASPG